MNQRHLEALQAGAASIAQEKSTKSGIATTGGKSDKYVKPGEALKARPAFAFARVGPSDGEEETYAREGRKILDELRRRRGSYLFELAKR
jgi:hypothetical protein